MNFTMAANNIGNTLVAMGIDVPEGSSLDYMAELIENHLMVRPTHQYGKVSVGSLNAGGYGTSISVAFNQAFKNVPKVTASSTGYYNGQAYSVVVRDIRATKTGFTAGVANNNSVPLSSIVVSWTATDI